jgi:hypothetical protein
VEEVRAWAAEEVEAVVWAEAWEVAAAWAVVDAVEGRLESRPAV